MDLGTVGGKKKEARKGADGGGFSGPVGSVAPQWVLHTKKR